MKTESRVQVLDSSHTCQGKTFFTPLYHKKSILNKLFVYILPPGEFAFFTLFTPLLFLSVWLCPGRHSSSETISEHDKNSKQSYPSRLKWQLIVFPDTISEHILFNNYYNILTQCTLYLFYFILFYDKKRGNGYTNW